MVKEGKILKRKPKAPKERPIKVRKKRTIRAKDKYSWCAYHDPQNKSVTITVDDDWDVIKEVIK